MIVLLSCLLLLLLHPAEAAGKRSQKAELDLYCERDNCYDVLEVEKTATKSEIKRSFRQISKTHHPDKKSKDPESPIIFAAAANAYEVLSNVETRKAYDYYVLHPEEHMTNQFAYYAQAAQKISIAPVLIMLIGVLTIFKYLANRFTYDSAVTNWKAGDNVKVRARKEALRVLGTPKKSQGRSGHKKEAIRNAMETWMNSQIEGGKIQEFPSKPDWRTLLAVQLIKSPYTMFQKCVWYNGFRRCVCFLIHPCCFFFFFFHCH